MGAQRRASMRWGRERHGMSECRVYMTEGKGGGGERGAGRKEKRERKHEQHIKGPEQLLGLTLSSNTLLFFKQQQQNQLTLTLLLIYWLQFLLKSQSIKPPLS